MPIYADPAEFGRALRNLIINAIRHTPADGTVEVLGDVQEGMAHSSGPTPWRHPAQDLPRVFDVAFRGEAARTPGPQEGAGLGLSIARGIVEAHSGQIAVRNAGPGCHSSSGCPGPPGRAARKPPGRRAPAGRLAAG